MTTRPHNTSPNCCCCAEGPLYINTPSTTISIQHGSQNPLLERARYVPNRLRMPTKGSTDGMHQALLQGYGSWELRCARSSTRSLSGSTPSTLVSAAASATGSPALSNDNFDSWPTDETPYSRSEHEGRSARRPLVPLKALSPAMARDLGVRGRRSWQPGNRKPVRSINTIISGLRLSYATSSVYDEWIRGCNIVGGWMRVESGFPPDLGW